MLHRPISNFFLVFHCEKFLETSFIAKQSQARLEWKKVQTYLETVLTKNKYTECNIELVETWKFPISHSHRYLLCKNISQSLFSKNLK